MGKTKKKSGVTLWFKDEKAQSMALGFVIIMGILLTSAIIFLSMEIPKQTKVLEAEHASKVPQDFAELSSAIDNVALSGDETASATCAVGMASKYVPFVGIQASGGTLRFDNSREKFECLACSPEEPIATGTDSWNCTPTDFMSMSYTKYHVDTNEDEGAKLKLEAGEDLIYDSGGEEYRSGDFCFNNFTVTNNTTLSTHLLTIHAINITIDSGSSINATGGGLFGGDNNEDGSGLGYGHTPGYEHWGAGAGGAGYNSIGGGGGYSDYGTGALGGSTYGSTTDRSTADFGSGGGGGYDAWHPSGYSAPFGGKGGDGGGAIFLDAPIINIYGNVSANGDDGLTNTEQATHGTGAGGGGGGSGGTILLEGNNITITGNLSAKGGKGGDGGDADDGVKTPSGYYIPGGGGGGGSGGRIKVFFTKLYGPSGPVTNVEQFFDTHTNVSGGTGGIRGYGDLPVKNAEAGIPGGIGSIHNESISTYVESVPHYPAGYMISSINDTGTAMILYKNITWAKTTLSGTNIYIKVRTSLNETMSDAMPWENCPPATNGTPISELYSVSDGHRYIQWRADLTTMERSRTPILKSMNISYERGRPVISSSKGSIEFSSHYFSLPNYVLVYEHGATIKNQTEGEFMLHPPLITISKSGNTTALKIYSVNLIGDDETASGVFSSAVKVSYRKADLVVGGLDFHNLSFNITTAYPTAWSRWFNKTCKAAGLAPEEYKIIGTGTAVQPLSIVLYGNESRPVNLWLKVSEVEVDVEG